VARNYLPQARCLAASLREQHPEAALSVLVVDGEFGGYDPSSEPFEVLTLRSLKADPVELRRMAALYDVLEYSTALKPWLLGTLLDRGATAVIYLDPDIWVYAPLGELIEPAATHELVLTPHAVAPMPRDGKSVSEATTLSSGVYNLGFVGVGRGSDAFLRFWKERLKRDCVIDHQSMRFVDQRWVDFAPGMFDTMIVRDPAYNVAYWNLDSRPLSFEDGRYLVDGRPLRFFHFSGYTPERRHLVSKHQGERPRILLSERPELRRLYDEYAGRLELHGYGSARLPAYGFGRTSGGLEMDRFVRAAYRDGVLQADLGEGEYPPDPWAPQGDDDFVAWLNSPAVYTKKVGRLSRYLAAVHAGRHDLQVVFPDPEGVDYPRVMYWARHEVRLGFTPGRLGFGTPAAVRRADGEVDVAEPGPRWAPPDHLRAGFNVVGYLKAELGIGESARLAVASLDAAGVPYETLTNDDTMSRQAHPFEVTPEASGAFDINLVIVNADRLAPFRDKVGPGFFAGRYTIGLWAWELEEFPANWSSAFDLVDEVWGVSEFTARCIAERTDKPVFAAPHAIMAPKVPSGVGRPELGLPEDSYLFLFCFDLLSIIDRKNPLGLIEAFRRAFAPGEGPTLAIKAINGDIRPNELERLKYAAAGRDDILLIDHYLDPGEQGALMAAADCYVSLHRSEGFGLTMAEAMALGKPVIATAYSANLEFMDADTAYLVEWTPGAVPPGSDPYPEGCLWADPDLDEAARLMRHVFEHPEEAAATGERARRLVEENHGPASRAPFYLERFEAIQRARAELIEHGLALARQAQPAPVAAGPPSPARRRAVARRLASRWPAGATAYRELRRISRGRPPAVSTPDAATEAIWHAQVQAQLTGVRVEIDGIHQGLDALRQSERQQDQGRERALSELRTRVHNLSGQIERADVRGELAQQAGRLGQISEASAGLRSGLDDLRAGLGELHSIPYTSDPSELMTVDDLGRPAIGYRRAGSGPGAGGDYAGFEDLFRGTEEFITERQRVYLPLLAGPVVDVGCGRGEMLTELGRLGVEAVGVDLDESMIERCRAKGLKVEHTDAVTFLSDLKEGSVGSIFCAQVIEHMAYEDLLSFLAEARRALRDDGVLIAETVNPHSVPAFKTFWTDLTHRVPIFPEVAVAVCREAGFGEAVVMWPNGTGDLDVDRWHDGEYAVIARKGVD
jgi:glycosyltransferase involved in cell wall biosynthesis/SAM-dependent methyltransferase